MMSDNIAIFADTHIGYRQYGMKERETDFEKALCEIIYQCEKLKLSKAAVAGDFLNSKRPSSATIQFLFKWDKILKEKGIAIYVVDGNHDGCKPSWIEIIEAQGEESSAGFKCINECDVLWGQIGNGTTLRGCPEFASEKVKEWVKEDKGCGILLLHLPVQQFIGYPSTTALDLEDIDLSGYQYVFIGDTHVNKEVLQGSTTIISPGSTEMNSVSEQDDKYFYVVDCSDATKLSHTKHKIKTRTVVTLNIMEETDLDSALEELKAEADNFPIVKGKYKDSIPNVLKRIKTVIDPDKMILQIKAITNKQAQNFQGETQEKKELPAYVADIIAKDDPGYDLAYALASDRQDPVGHVDTFIEKRTLELKKP